MNTKDEAAGTIGSSYYVNGQNTIEIKGENCEYIVEYIQSSE